MAAGKVHDLGLTTKHIEEQVMGRTKKISDKEILAMVARVLAFDAESLQKEDFVIDGLDFGMNESLAWTLAPPPLKSPTAAPALPPVSGARMICIRVPERVLRAFKAKAVKSGSRYQSLMNRALKTAAEDFV